jgi:hypothetical protein
MRKYFAPVCAALVLFGGVAAAEDKPREIIERAIKAHGGQNKLERITCDKVKAQGVMHIGDDDVPFTTETFVQLPGQFKSTVVATQNDRKRTIVQILNGDKTSVTVDGQPIKVTAASDLEMRENMHLERAVRLVPLLTDKAFELAALEETKVNDQPANSVRVSMKGHKDLRMYFDKETNLLMKTEHMLEEPKEGKEFKQEEYYGDFKDLGGGFTRPTRITVYRDGKKIMEAKLTEVKYLEKIPETEFTKP